MQSNENNLDRSLFVFADKTRKSAEESAPKAPSVGYFKDAWRRFSKNRSSLAALVILAVLVLFCILAPLLSPYTLADKESVYPNKRPILPLFENAGFWDGGRENEFTEDNYYYFLAIARETGATPILKTLKSYEKTQTVGGVQKTTKMYRLRVDSYKEVGVVNGLNISKADFEAICRYQDETGRRVLMPLVDTSRLYGFDRGEGGGNYWYEIDKKGKPVLSGGEFQPLYLSVAADSPLKNQYAEYDSLRAPTDDGSFVYGKANQSGYSTRIYYYEYYRYKNGYYPKYYFGTNTYGQDIFAALGNGAAFSLLLSLGVSALNLLIGAAYGAIEGYYGGKVDLFMERFAEILSGIPFTVVVTLFAYHLAAKVGVIPSFLFAFITTGWISTASLTRKQFYRFKNREYVMAARTLGAKDGRIILKHVFPNSVGTIITSAAMLIPSVIGLETTLTYLGIVNLSAAGATSLGTLIELGKTSLDTAPHVLLFPAVFLALVMISFNLLGNGLRDAFNPTLRFSE
ncbi:MAG: ABC transporter permease [Clostridia bacterium]|nr:ABC transporter permease [Clostridia bacterium]